MVDVNAIMGTISTILYIVVGLAVVGGAIWFAFVYRKYNKIVQIYDQVNGSALVREVKAREVYDDKNILCWYLKSEKITKSCPPKEAICVKKGKKFAMLIRVRGDQYNWLDASTFTPLPDKEVVSKENKPNHAGTGKFFVISEDAKRQLADQIKKAEQEKQTKLNDLVNKIMPIAAIAVLLIGAYFIFDAISSNVSEMTDKFVSMTATQQKAIEQQAGMWSDIQEILNQRNNSVIAGQNIIVTPPNRIPN